MKPNLLLWILPFLALLVAACAPTQAATDLPQETVDSVAPTDEVVPTSTSTAAPATVAPTSAPLFPLIAPETLGQLRLLWNVNFPGDINGDRLLWTNIAAYAFSQDGSTLAASVCFGMRTQDRSQPDQDEWGCTAESAIILYDAATGEERGRLAPAALPLSLAFHPDGAILAAGLANSQIELWDLDSAELADTLSGAPIRVGVAPLEFTSDGNMLISGSRSGFQLQLWDWRSAALLTTIERVYGIGISPDSGSLVTLHLANEPDAIHIYDLPQADSFAEIPLAGQYAPTEFSFNLQNGWMSSVEFGSNSYLANFWDPESAALQASLDFNQDFDEIGVLYDLNSGGFTPGGYFLMERAGSLNAPEAQPEATGLSETLWACGFALADLEAKTTYFTPPMLFDDCAASPYMYDMGLTHQAKILSPDGRFIAADDAFGNLRVWGIDASQPPIAPECSGDC